MFHLGFTGTPEIRDARGMEACDRGKGARFVALMQDRGVRLIGRGLWYVSAVHSEEDLDLAVDAAAECFGILRG
jgi:glutamate-1-semialdehyde 2,1-aminomutase